MATLESLPPDQRAVLQLVLQRGRSYDQIASMLSIDRAAVRDRALSALDALGPQTRVQPARRALITDYLLGQLPPMVAVQVHDRLATSPSERAWARIMSSELSTLAREPLPAIPTSAAPRQAAPPTPAPVATPAAPVDDGEYENDDQYDDDENYGRRDDAPPAISRAGGWMILGTVVVVVIVIVIAVVLANRGSNNNTPSTAGSSGATTGTTATSSSTAGQSSAATTTTTTPSTSDTSSTPNASTSTTKTPAAKRISQAALTAPSGKKSPVGEAEVVTVSGKDDIIVGGKGLTPNNGKDAYAVWLTAGAKKSVLLGFVKNLVTSNGELEAGTALPKDAADFTQVIITLETVEKPTAPGKIVLQGPLQLK